MKEKLTDSSTKKQINSQQQHRGGSLLRSGFRANERDLEGTSEGGSFGSLLPNWQSSMPSSAVVQTKLTVNEPDDQYEQEAERVADTVMRMPLPMVAPPASPAAVQPPVANPLHTLRRRASERNDSDRRRKPPGSGPSLMRVPTYRSMDISSITHTSPIQALLIAQARAKQAKAVESRPPVSPALESRIEGMNGSGNPLPDSERNFFESRMGADFSGVRIHTDHNAVQTSRDIKARAFTTHNNIAFNLGEYQPGTTAGRHLLAHELTHTVQQGASPQLKRQVIQREEETQETQESQETQGPTPEEKAAALAAAAEAEAIAGQARATAQSEVAQSQGEAVVEKSAAEGSKAEVAASIAEGPVQQNERKQLEMAAEGQAQSQAAAGVVQQEAAQGKAESATSALLAQPAAGEAAPAPLAMTGGAVAASGAGLEGATSAASASVESAYSQAENAPDKAPTTAEEDPGYSASVGAAQAVGEAQQTHEPAEGKASEAQAAAESPAAELEGQAQTAQVGKLEQTETPAFDAATFKQALMDKIASLAPKSADEADNLKESGKVDTLKGDMQGQVNEEQTASQGPLEEASQEAPDMNAAEPKSVTPLEATDPGPAPSEIGADKAVPKPKGQGEVEAPIAESNQALDQQMADAEITEEQLQNSNEPEFASALSAKGEAQAQAEQGVTAYRQGEQAQISGAEAEAVSAAQAATQGMFDTRSSMLAQTEGQQQQGKSEDEKAREKVASDISGIYDKTKSKVEQTLSQLDGKVTRVFDAGAEAASTAFENFVDAKMEAYKEERYGGMLGWAAWAKDKLMGMPSEVNAFYTEGRKLYIAKMDAVIDNVVAIISSTLAKAKAEVANGKREIQAYVEQLPEDLKQVGQNAAQEIQGKFDELEQQVNDKQGELIDTLAQKYNDNLQAVDARIDELKAANKGLVDKVLDAVGGVIQKILELKRMLEGVLARAQAAIKQIIKDPIGFLGNLINAVKQGFNQFVANIGTHLSKGLVSWLTGTIAQAGITLPDNFDLQGIFQLVLQVTGLSFDQIIGKLGGAMGVDLNDFIEPVTQVITIYQEEGFGGLVKSGLSQVIGEENVEALMEVVDMVKMVISGDFGGLWELVKEHLTNLKEMVMGKIQEIVTMEVIEAGVKWVLSLFNPAGAFIKACMMIYDVVMFFVDNGSKIMALVNSVIDSVTSIANGDIGSAANAIEQALATSIPIAIDFLASLLGLGDLPEKIKGVITTVREAVDNAIDKILQLPPVQMIMGFIKKLIDKVKGLVAGGIDKAKGALGMGDEKEGEGEGEGAAEPATVKAGLAAIDAEEKKYLNEKGKIQEEEAQQVAATVQGQHPVFQSIRVVDGGGTWDYDYSVQREEKKGEEKETEETNLETQFAQAKNSASGAMSTLQKTWKEKKQEHSQAIYNVQNQINNAPTTEKRSLNTYKNSLEEFERHQILLFEQTKLKNITERWHDVTDEPYTEEDAELFIDEYQEIKQEAEALLSEINAMQIPVSAEAQEEEQPAYVKENRPPRDDETILANMQRTNLIQQGRRVYTDGDQYYYVDNFHSGEGSEIEVFNSQGNHLGTIHPDGTEKDGAIRGRTINV